MLPLGKENSTAMVGVFELCNPHLLPEETLVHLLTSNFLVNTANMSKSKMLELVVSNMTPREQREYRDNRRGTLLKQLQQSSSNENILDINKIQVHGSESPVNKNTNKRDSSDTGGPELKRSKISWP